MNSDEIKKEAQKRLDNMTPEQKKAALGMSDEEQQRLDNARNYWKMSKAEQSKFEDSLLKKLNNSHVGGWQQGGFERDLQDDFGISRDDIKKMAKNPYKAKMLKDMLWIVLLNVGSAALAVTGLGVAIPALEMPAGIFALDFARNVKNYFKYKKIQKKYVSGELTQEEIKTEMYQQLLAEQKAMKEEQGRRM